MHSFFVSSANFAIGHILLKTRFFDYVFVEDTVSILFNHFDVIGPNLPNSAQ